MAHTGFLSPNMWQLCGFSIIKPFRSVGGTNFWHATQPSSLIGLGFPLYLIQARYKRKICPITDIS